MSDSCYFCKSHPAHEPQREELMRLKNDLREKELQISEMLSKIEKFKCSERVEECTARHIGYNLAIDDVLEVLRSPEKPEGLTVHGNIEPGLRCSASGCDELATCKECFGCKAHCDDLKART